MPAGVPPLQGARRRLESAEGPGRSLDPLLILLAREAVGRRRLGEQAAGHGSRPASTGGDGNMPRRPRPTDHDGAAMRPPGAGESGSEWRVLTGGIAPASRSWINFCPSAARFFSARPWIQLSPLHNLPASPAPAICSLDSGDALAAAREPTGARASPIAGLAWTPSICERSSLPLSLSGRGRCAARPAPARPPAS